MIYKQGYKDIQSPNLFHTAQACESRVLVRVVYRLTTQLVNHLLMVSSRFKQNLLSYKTFTLFVTGWPLYFGIYLYTLLKC